MRSSAPPARARESNENKKPSTKFQKNKITKRSIQTKMFYPLGEKNWNCNPYYILDKQSDGYFERQILFRPLQFSSFRLSKNSSLYKIPAEGYNL